MLTESPLTVIAPLTTACAPIEAHPTKSISDAVMPEACGSSMNVCGSTSRK
jgi:hypothetical protein